MTTSTTAGRVGGPVLVTGAAGFIGSHVCRALVARGQAVVGVDNFDPFYARSIKERAWRELQQLGCTLVEADITDAGAMSRLFAQSAPASVVHLAAKAGVRPSIADPAGYAHANVTGTSVILESARAAKCDRIVIASSSSVYGNNRKVPFAEEDDVSGPISPYAATKRACELLAHAHHHLTGMPTALLRFFTVYGPGQRPDLAISLFLESVALGKPIRMFGDGSSSRDYTFIDDIVAGVLGALDRVHEHGFRIWNLGGSDPVSLAEMIRTVGRVVGREPIIQPVPAQPGDVERTCADVSRARHELGFAPSTALEKGIALQWAYAKSHVHAQADVRTRAPEAAAAGQRGR